MKFWEFWKTENMTKDLPKVGLEYYDKRPGEPQSSVMGSLDYNFAVSRYPKDSFCGSFAAAYIRFIKESEQLDIFNCRFERPQVTSNFVNYYIYLKKMDLARLAISYRIGDENHSLIKAFYKVMENNRLPGISEETRIQFLVKNFDQVTKEHSIALAWRSIHKEISAVFPEVAFLSSWTVFYVFVNENQFERIMSDSAYLEKVRKYCFEATKKCDIDGAWIYKDFHIRIDNYKNYKAIGGQHYFNSDLMSNCAVV